MKKHLFKLSAFILSLCTAICSIPLTLAAAGDSLEREEVDPLPAEDESSADENVPFIIGEDDELRAESVKHFRLSDGSYLMVDYGTPVHYESDGDWLDIYGSYTSIDSVQESCEYADIDIRWDGEVIDMRGAVNFASKLFTKNDH